MSRRVSLPSADDLFRPTVVPDRAATGSAIGSGSGTATGTAEVDRVGSGQPLDDEMPPGTRTPSGRVRHDEKMTIYVTADELLDIEHARLTLRRGGLTVDRGRLVREAVALVLADLEHNGDDSVIVARLTQA